MKDSPRAARTTHSGCAATERRAGQQLMQAAMHQLSARSYRRVLKLVRTIANWASAPEPDPAHLAEARGVAGAVAGKGKLFRELLWS